MKSRIRSLVASIAFSLLLHPVSADFRHPSVAFRPRLRYWIPDAHVDVEQVYDDIAQAGARGAAGVEVLGFYLYGAEPGTFVPTDWSAYGWGTPAWKAVLDTTIRAHRDHGLLMDVAIGPNQGQGVPAHEDEEGLQWDLSPHHTIVSGKTFLGTVPGWGTGKLQAAVTGKIVKTTNTTSVMDLSGERTPATRYTLAESSLEDVTFKVGKDGRLDVDFPSDKKHGDHIVFAVYLVRSGARTQQPPAVLRGPQTTPIDYVHNGSWTVDHFSAKGARVMTDFWEGHLLVNGTREALQQVARCMWEDSIEINPNVYWTPDLPTSFVRQHGYSLNKFYPLLFHGNSLLDHFKNQFVTDEPDGGQSHVDDYRETLTQGYGEYLNALQSWAQSLGVQWSSQIGYNLAIDMPALVHKADLPECEDLAFGSNIDAYRQFTAPANLAGKPIVSAEVGAILGQAYQMTIPRWLQLLHRLFAGGVNAVVLHGLAYSGAYPNTTWPGYAPFTYAWSDVLGRHQPAWDFIGETFDYFSRTMYILQQGTQKMDVAFYQKRTSYKHPSTGFEPDDLLRAGYTYGYLDPETLSSSNADVQGGVLAPEKQAYKVLIVRGSDTVSVKAADMLARHARAGLPIIFAGGLPTYPSSHHDHAGRAYIHQTLHSLRHLDNVHHVAHEYGLSGVLSKLSIKPRTKILSLTEGAHWWPVWRETKDGREQFVYIYNDGDEQSEGTIKFQSTGQPYRYDACSGTITPIGVYTQKGKWTTIHFVLEPHQAMIIGFHNDEPPILHATDTSDGVLDVHLEDDGIRAVIGSSKMTQWVCTSDGVVHRVPSTRLEPFNLKKWTLTVEHWDPPELLTNISPVAVRWNTTHHLKKLASWQHIPGLNHVSGRGYYSTSFFWNGGADGAYLSLGPIIHTMSVSVNGQAVPPLDGRASARVDISQYLVAGENTVEVTVSTTLANRLAPIWDSLRTSGAPPTGLFGSNTRPPGDADYGLVGPVEVVPYRMVALGQQSMVMQDL
ncbi:hypothetical protein SEUCBS139899_008229 [Sporothrix eucalyptigena]